MSDSNFLAEERDRLLTVRDELRVQIHLASAEARDLFESLERDWNRFEGRMAVLAGVAKAEAADVGDAARLLLDEIKDGYEHLRSQM